MSSLTPLGHNVLIKPIEAETMTASGIVIPDTASQEKPMKGTVIAAATPAEGDDSVSGATLRAITAGDTVYFTKYAPTELKVNGEDLYILDAKSVLAVEQA